MNLPAAVDLSQHVPTAIRRTHLDQRDIPRIARDPAMLGALEGAARAVPTQHLLLQGDARDLSRIPDESIHLILTSPPYWTLKDYRKSEGQLGHVRNYEDFLDQLDAV